MLNTIKKGIILGLFCAVSALLLAGVYQATRSKIGQNLTRAFEISKSEVLSNTGGRAIKVSPRGYAGSIDMLVGVARGRVVGVKILRQTETPGLGSNIAKEHFLQQFIGKTGSDRIEPRQDIDAITGATISSRAVCQGIKEALKKAK